MSTVGTTPPVLELSSNWKRLQAQLAQQQQSSEISGAREKKSKKELALKRKINAVNSSSRAQHSSKKYKANGKDEHGISDRRNNVIGRLSRNENRSHSGMTMGSYISSTTNGDNVDPAQAKPITNTSEATHDAPRIGRYLALDAEMVATSVPVPDSIRVSASSIGPHDDRAVQYSILARCSLVNYELETIYDAYVLPPRDPNHNAHNPPHSPSPSHDIDGAASHASPTSEHIPRIPIVDYRTPHSGITSTMLQPGNALTGSKLKSPERVKREVRALLRGRVLVGHALTNDLAVLGLAHPREHTRDTATHSHYRTLPSWVSTPRSVGAGRGGYYDSFDDNGAQPHTVKDNAFADIIAPQLAAASISSVRSRKPALRLLAQQVLGWQIQRGGSNVGHSSVEDARAAMALYRADKRAFEEEARARFGARANLNGAATATGTSGDEREFIDADSSTNTDVDADANADVDVNETRQHSNAQSKRQKKKKKKKKPKYGGKH